MVGVTASVMTGQDNTDKLVQALQYLRDHEVFVGVPEKNLNRGDEGTISNAQLLYIHTHGIRRAHVRRRMDEFMEAGAKYSKAFEMYLQENGDPIWHAVPRPVLDPAIRSVKFQILEQMGKATAAALDGDVAETRKRMRMAGTVARNAARGWMQHPPLTENRPATQEIKKAKVKGKKKIVNPQPLVDTGSLRKAIIYVVRKRTGAEAIR